MLGAAIDTRAMRLSALWGGKRRSRQHPFARTWLHLALLGGDALALALAFAAAYAARFKMGVPWLETPAYSGSFYSWVAFWAIPVWIGLLWAFRLYDRANLFHGADEYIRVINASTAGFIAVVLISFLDATIVISRGWLLLTWVLAISFVCSMRFVARQLVRTVRARGLLVTPTVIVGSNEEAVALAEQLLTDRAAGVQLLGFVDPELPRGTHVSHGLEVVGDLWALDSLGARQIVVASSSLTRDQLIDLYWTYGQDPRVELRLSSGLYEILTTGVTVQHLSSIPLVTPQRTRITGVDAVVKGAIDYVTAMLLVLALAPVMLILAILVRIDSSGPILHRRRVLGVSGRAFDAFKFRTMVPNADEVLARSPEMLEAFSRGYKLASDPRITRIGRFLRRTSLDELPQLFNVLRGEMSLVGPRMIAPEEAARYGKWQRNLVTVKPGITGPWQVQGRSDLPYEQRVTLSMHYIRNYTFWLDLTILVRTILVVLRGKGAY